MSAEVLQNELFLMYERAPKTGPVPKLDEDQQVQFIDLIEEHGLRMIAGYSSFHKDPNISSMRTSDDMVAPMERFPGSVIGPYFLEGKYFPNALGAWVVNKSADSQQAQ